MGFILEAPSYLAVMQHADSIELRKETYTAFVTRASDQGPTAGRWDNSAVMQAILTNRLEKAKLLGFQNFVEFSLSTKMVSTPQQVLDFLEHLLTASKAKAQEEINELKSFAAEHSGEKDLQVWDIAYYSEKLRQKRYAVSRKTQGLFSGGKGADWFVYHC